jgi:hypothetical protein
MVLTKINKMVHTISAKVLLVLCIAITVIASSNKRKHRLSDIAKKLYSEGVDCFNDYYKNIKDKPDWPENRTQVIAWCNKITSTCAPKESEFILRVLAESARRKPHFATIMTIAMREIKKNLENTPEAMILEPANETRRRLLRTTRLIAETMRCQKNLCV